MDEFIDEVLKDQMDVLSQVKQSDIMVIQKGIKSVRKLSISGYLHMAPNYTRFCWPGVEKL